MDLKEEFVILIMGNLKIMFLKDNNSSFPSSRPHLNTKTQNFQVCYPKILPAQETKYMHGITSFLNQQ